MMKTNKQHTHWKAFAASSQSIAHVNLDWVCLSEPWGLANAYHLSADALVDAAFSDVRQEDYFLPAAYLYRHCFELALKTIIRDACNLYREEKPVKVLGCHKLRKLWAKAKEYLIRMWGNDIATLDRADALIEEFAKVDNDGQAFRYHTCKDGSRPIEQLPKVIDLENLKLLSGNFFIFLDECHAGFTAALDAQNEALESY